MRTRETALSFDTALIAVLAALGRPPPLPRALPAEASVDERAQAGLEGSGLQFRPMEVGHAGLAPVTGDAAILLEVSDSTWIGLLPRPDGTWEAVDAEGGLIELSEPPAHTGRALVLSPLAEPPLVDEAMPFLRRHAHLLMPVMLAGVITNVLALALPLFGSFVYDKVLGNGISDTLWAVSLGVLLAIAMDMVARALRIQLIERVAVTTEGDIDRALFANLLRKSGGIPPVGLVLDKYKQLLASRDFVSSTYLMAATDLPFVVLFLGAIAIVAGPLVLIPLLVGVASVALNLLMGVPAREYEALARHAGEQRISLLADTLMGREVVVTSALRGDLASRWRRTGDAAAAASGRARFWNTLANSVSLSASSLAYAGVLVGGAYLVDAHLLTSGGIMAASMLTSRSMATMASVTLLATRLREFRRALRELDQILPAAAMPETESQPSDPSGHIQLVGLRWKPSAESRPVLDGLTLHIRPGEIVGIAGLPGAGKTTLMRLIAGAEKPSEGQVLLDMIPVQNWDSRQTARAIGYKTQDALLFEGTLASNVKAGNTRASAEQMADCLARSGLAQAIERGELTLATQVGPRGSRLSGGQRQMVALARALLGDPPILLLDEPSTGFDAQLERSLADYIAGLAGKRTVLVSSHSRTLLGICTRIIVLNQGRIGADGPRDKVLAG
ncbi:MAG: ATP-binding cassette domain-containing protein [Magnetospirillum sp.]|nr:ATP-binding cassette domain-containing protein [Magnetospirillum sp.]